MKTEYQKCMDGEFFTADSEMLQIVYRCKRLVRILMTRIWKHKVNVKN